MTDLGNGLIAVSVPEYAQNLELSKKINDNVILFNQGTVSDYINIGHYGFDFEILGTITASEISFDVDKIPYPWNSKGRFRVLIESKGLWFDNKFGFTEQNLVQKLVILKRTP